MSQNPQISRRSFIKVAGLALGGATLTCAGTGYLANLPPAIEMKETECKGEIQVKNKILVAYASKSGTAVEVAEAIGQGLCAQGASVDVRPVKAVKNLDSYQAVVIGSAIRMGAWLPEAVEFVQNNQARLGQLPTAIFTVHLQALDDSPESQAQRQSYIEPLRKLLNPAAITFFAGRMDFSKLSFFERLISKAIKAQEEDKRDWNKINAWAANLIPALNLAG